MADENRSDPCGCWCTWYSKEGDGRIHQESIRESYVTEAQKIYMLESAQIFRND